MSAEDPALKLTGLKRYFNTITEKGRFNVRELSYFSSQLTKHCFHFLQFRSVHVAGLATQHTALLSSDSYVYVCKLVVRPVGQWWWFGRYSTRKPWEAKPTWGLECFFFPTNNSTVSRFKELKKKFEFCVESSSKFVCTVCRTKRTKFHVGCNNTGCVDLECSWGQMHQHCWDIQNYQHDTLMTAGRELPSFN